MNVLQVENLIGSYRKSVIKESEEDVKLINRRMERLNLWEKIPVNYTGINLRISGTVK